MSRSGGGSSRGVSMTRGTLYLVVASLGISTLHHLLSVDIPLLVDGRTLPELNIWALLTNTLVTMRSSFVHFAVFMAIAGFLFWDRIRVAWYVSQGRLIATIGIPLALLFILDNLAPKGVVWGMASATVMLVWFATTVERRWGTKRLLIFSLTISLITNLFAAGMVVLWPGSVLAAVGISFAPLNGVGPLTYALLTVWCLMNSRQYFPLLRVQVKSLIWLLVALATVDFIFQGRLAALMELLAIGVTCLLVHGLWRPRHLADRVRLWWIDRRVAKRRSRMRSIDGGRDH